jgi:hypothetical protein
VSGINVSTGAEFLKLMEIQLKDANGEYVSSEEWTKVKMLLGDACANLLEASRLMTEAKTEHEKLMKLYPQVLISLGSRISGILLNVEFLTIKSEYFEEYARKKSLLNEKQLDEIARGGLDGLRKENPRSDNIRI